VCNCCNVEKKQLVMLASLAMVTRTTPV
jgi:hypothetical protein